MLAVITVACDYRILPGDSCLYASHDSLLSIIPAGKGAKKGGKMAGNMIKKHTGQGVVGCCCAGMVGDAAASLVADVLNAILQSQATVQQLYALHND
jgi:hypothetical protein